MPNSGIVYGKLASGSKTEQWAYMKNAVTKMKNIPYQDGSNEVPIEGHAPASSGVVLVEVYGTNVPKGERNFHFYSVPVKSDGTFSATIELPWQGKELVCVGEPNKGSVFKIESNYAYLSVNNKHTSLTTDQMYLLQSWMVNYNEAPNIRVEAKQLASDTSTRLSGENPLQIKDATIKAVSDWVSKNIRYDNQAEEAGNIPWKQASQTYQERLGVCQDESAVAASMLRTLGIPTKMIEGYAISNGQKVSHSWLKSWDGQRWITFDPTWDNAQVQIAPGLIVHVLNDDYFNPAPGSDFYTTHIRTGVSTW